MAYPPTSNQATGFVIAGGAPAIAAWGADGLLTSGYIVKSIRATDINEVIYIENGKGLRCKRITLVQGREYEISVEDDMNILAPNIGTTMVLLDPLSNWVSKNITVLEASQTSARKQNGERVIKCVYDTLIEGNGVIP